MVASVTLPAVGWGLGAEIPRHGTVLESENYSEALDGGVVRIIPGFFRTRGSDSREQGLLKPLGQPAYNGQNLCVGLRCCLGGAWLRCCLRSNLGGDLVQSRFGNPLHQLILEALPVGKFLGVPPGRSCCGL